MRFQKTTVAETLLFSESLTPDPYTLGSLVAANFVNMNSSEWLSFFTIVANSVAVKRKETQLCKHKLKVKVQPLKVKDLVVLELLLTYNRLLQVSF